MDAKYKVSHDSAYSGTGFYFESWLDASNFAHSILEAGDYKGEALTVKIEKVEKVEKAGEEE